MTDSGKIFDWTLDAALIFLVVFTPLAFGSVHVWAYTLMEAVVLLLLALWAVKGLLGGEIKIDRTLVPVYISFLIFIAYCYVQTIPVTPDTVKTLSPKAFELYSMAIPGYAGSDTARSLSLYSYATKTNLLKFAAYFGVFFLITNEVKSERRIRRLIIAIIAIGFLEAMYGLYGYFSNDPYIFGIKNIHYKESATGTFVNRNHFAGFLGITTFVALGYLLSRVHPQKSGGYYSFGQKVFDFLNTARATKGALLLIAVVVMAMGIAFSLSRMGVFSLMATGFIILLVTSRGARGSHSKVLLAVIAFVLIAGLWYGLDPLEERYYSSSDDLFRSRLVVWKATGDLIGDYPLVGTGLGTYEHVFQRYKPVDFSGGLSIFQHAHNDYMEMLSETGILGTFIVAVGGLYFLVILVRKIYVRTDPAVKGIVLGMGGSIIYIALHSITDFNMHIPSNAMLLFIVMALAYRVAVVRRRKRVDVKG